jgi:hypothetical protein
MPMWVASIKRGNRGRKTFSLIKFDSQSKAAAAYDIIATRIHNEYHSTLNNTDASILSADKRRQLIEGIDSFLLSTVSSSVVGHAKAQNRGSSSTCWSFSRAEVYFMRETSEGPHFVCGCCHQTWFRKLVRVAS